ncbi:MAG: dihydroorotate dehydrogenase (quinone) [Bifidobacteriaceae bacterium]|jgi:dihydroorotate dehydrogenase (fumarate)|nr:dihydroorotate dehydrogenase (quinone) [Bifidobacteriaceae bacterium]
MTYVSESAVHNSVNKVSTALFQTAYKYGVKKAVFAMTPDKAHEATMTFGRDSGKIAPLMWLLREMIDYTDPILETNVMGVDFDNPFGLSAGLDKNCDLPTVLEAAGFGFETVGSTTARPSEGNPRPWFHRLPQYASMMVHVGLANDGSEKVIRRVEKAYTQSKTMRLSVSIARTNDNLTRDDAEGIEDYRISMERAANRSHMIEVNISCPNTRVGERFVDPTNLDKLFDVLDTVTHDQPVLVKMPQDKAWPEFRDLLDVLVEHKVDGVTIANLRKDRTGLDIPENWEGNLSGMPAGPASDDLVERTYRDYGDKLAIAGVGGVFTREQAYRKIRKGSSLVMFVSSLMYRGPQNITTLKRGLADLLRADGFNSVDEAVGIDVD